MLTSPLFFLLLSAVFLTSAAFALTLWSWRVEGLRDGRVTRSLSRVAWGLIGGIALVAFVLWSREQKIGASYAPQFFEKEAARIQIAVNESLLQYENLLRGGSEILASDRADAGAWQRYVSSLNLPKRFPSIYGMGYAAYVPQAGIHRVVDNARRANPSWTLTPPGERFDYFVVEMIEPLAFNKSLLGYDLGSELSARTAAERSRDKNTVALTGKMILLDDPQHRAFLLFYPVSLNATTLQGWTFMRFRTEDILQGILSSSQLTYAFQVFDGPIRSKETLFYSNTRSPEVMEDTPTSASGMIEVAGRPWALLFSAEGGVDNPEARTRATAIILLGFVLCGSGWGGLWLLAASRRRAGQLAEEFTSTVRDREKALTSGPHGILLVDAAQPDLPIVYVNPRFERITGYSASDVIGKNPRFLYKGDSDQKNIDEVRKAIREQRETKVLLRNYRKDGTPFWNEFHLSPIRNDHGRLTHFSGVMQDVTEREQAERRLTTQVSVIRALSEAPGVEEASRNILQAICESQGWDLGTLWRVDIRAQVLRCVDVWCLPDVKAEEFEKFVRDTTYPKEMGLPGMVWAKGEALWFADVVKDANFPEASIIAKQGLNGACGFPVMGAQGIIGILAFYSRRIWPLNKNLMLLMAGTASQISQGMEMEKAVFQQRELTALERGMAEFLGEGLMAMDREGFCIYANTSAGRLLSGSPRQLLGKHLPDQLQPDQSHSDGTMQTSALRLSLQLTKPKHFFQNQTFRTLTGSSLPVSFMASPIIDKGLIQGVVVTFLDATELHATLEEQQHRLEEKENEVRALQEALLEAQKRTPENHPSEELLSKIRGLLKDIS